MTVSIRAIAPADEAVWRELWTGYLEFYESRVSEEVYASTFARFFDEGRYEPNCMLAEIDGKVVGLVHYLLHRHCWKIEDACYLQDLFTTPGARGSGAGRALITGVYAEADRLNAPQVYWTTQTFNQTARKLYDDVGQLTPFIKYQRPADN